MKLKILLLFTVILFSNLSYAQFTTKQIKKCIEAFSHEDSCIYLRDFGINFSYDGKSKNWNININSGTIYILQLCDGKKFIKKAPGAKIGLYKSDDINFENSINEAPIGGHFIFRCKEAGDYTVRIWIKESVKYGGAVGVLYYKGKFEID